MDVKYNLGKFEGGRHFFPVRIFYNHTDAGGIVYHANYLRIAEEARCAMFDTMYDGMEKSQNIHAKVGSFVSRKIEIDYLSSARYGDDLVVESRFQKIGRTSLEMVQDIKRGEDLLVTIRIVTVCVTIGTIKPEKLPDALVERIQKVSGL
jgi:acyl-CoA thioester hydrolase